MFYVATRGATLWVNVMVSLVCNGALTSPAPFWYAFSVSDLSHDADRGNSDNLNNINLCNIYMSTWNVPCLARFFLTLKEE